MDYSNFLFRCHYSGDLMSGTGNGWKSIENSVTAQKRLIQIFLENEWKRKLSFSNKYTEKGIGCEEDSLKLYGEVKNHFFLKNEIRLQNEFLSGEVDSFYGDEILRTEHTIDVKTSYTWETFIIAFAKPDSDYIFQGHCYMALTGAKKHTIAYCLINNTAAAIASLKEKAKWRHQIIDIETEDYILECKEIEKNHIVDMPLFQKTYPGIEIQLHHSPNEWIYDIPAKERVIEHKIERDEVIIANIYKRLAECRIYMQGLKNKL